MTQLAPLKRKLNFASDKQIGHVIICTYRDKGKEGRLGAQLSQNTSQASTPLCGLTLGFGQDIGSLCSKIPHATLVLRFPYVCPPPNPSAPHVHTEACQAGNVSHLAVWISPN